MLNIPGYTVIAMLHQSWQTIVYRGHGPAMV